MKTNLFFLIIVFSLTNSYSQEITYLKPDYEEIKKEITDSSSVYYYPKLMKKFDAADFSMPLEESRCLYYGFVFQEDYEWQQDSKYINNIKGEF